MNFPPPTRWLVVLVGIACAAISGVSDQPWPMCYHDARHTGHSDYPGPLTFSMKWQKNGLDPGGVIGSGGVLYVNGSAGGVNHIYALDIATGDVLASAEEPCTIQALGPDGTAYAVCGEEVNRVCAFNGSDLHKLWENPVSGTISGQLIVGPTGDVLVRTYSSGAQVGQVVSLSGQSGQQQWEYTFPDPYSSHSPMAVSAGNRIIVHFFPSFALDGATGTKLWESYDVRGHVPVIGANGFGYGFIGGAVDDTGTLVAYDINSGAAQWSVTVWGDTLLRTPPSYMMPTTPALDSAGRVYLPWGRYLYVFDGFTGDWLHRELSPDADCTSVVVDGSDHIYVSCGLSIFVVQPMDFHVIAQYEAPADVDGLIIGPERIMYAKGMALGEGGYVLPNLFLVPAAAHVAGASGTSWRTDLAIHNPSSYNAAHLMLALLKSGQGNSDFTPVEREIPANTSVEMEDTVLSLFGHDGSGAILIQSDSPDLIITSRTYNDQPQGTYGQFVPAAREADLGGGRLIQLTENNDYRTNVGLASLSELEQTVALDLCDAAGALLGQVQVPLPPLGHVQINQIFKSVGVDRVKNGFIKVGGTRLAAYASVVDNRTGDAVYVPAAGVK